MSLAVVVQRTGQCRRLRASLFTADPVTGDDSVIEINAAWGLGEAMVGGQVYAGHVHRGTMRSGQVTRTGRSIPRLIETGPRRR